MMNRQFIYLLTISLLFISCELNSRSNEVQTLNKSQSDTKSGIIHNVSVSEFKEALQIGDATLVDIRTPQEYQQGHLEGAINIDWYQRSFRNLVLHIPKDKPILIYCRSGNRTSKTSGVLKALGYTEIYNLARGINQWIIEKAPITNIDSKINTDFQNKIKNTKTENIAETKLTGKIYNVSAVDFQKVVQLKKVSVVDIRTPQEFKQGHIKNAINIDWYQRSFRDFIQDVPKDKPIAIYCRSGNRTSKAANLLQSLGFTEIINLNYGIVDWQRNAFLLEK